jgi:hypothetical protein
MSPVSARPLAGDEATLTFNELLPAFRGAMLVTHTLDGDDPHVTSIRFDAERAEAGPSFGTHLQERE